MGSFHTITTHGTSGSTTFSSMGSSISTGGVSTGAVEGIGDTIRRPSHEDGAMSRCERAPRHRALVATDGLGYPVTRGSTYHARNARIARTMITIAEYLIAAYPTSEFDSGSWIVGGSCTCSSSWELIPSPPLVPRALTPDRPVSSLAGPEPVPTVPWSSVNGPGSRDPSPLRTAGRRSVRRALCASGAPRVAPRR